MINNVSVPKERNSVIEFFSLFLKSSFYFTHAVVSLIDKKNKTYVPYMFDQGAKHLAQEYDYSLLGGSFNANDPFMSALSNSEEPVSFLLDEMIHVEGAPAFIRVNYERGIRKIMLTRLSSKSEALAFMFIYSDRTDSFPESFKSFVKGIVPYLANAIFNSHTTEVTHVYKHEMPVQENHVAAIGQQASHDYPGLVGHGPAMQKVYHMMSLVAGSNATVLLQGETGTGKEVIARAIHNSSPRKNKPMIKVNCAALPASLVESELFGYEKGSFTGATERRIGKFELAHSGTLFLDEIGEMPLELQVKLLRALQEREIERVGGKAPIKVDVRIIAATNRDLDEEVKAGRFRSDLYYRLNVFPINLPPLRNRVEDIEELASAFLLRYTKTTGKNIKAISPDVIKQLKSYEWPGNVRELEHMIERGILLTNDSVLREIPLPQQAAEKTTANVELRGKSLLQIERTHIIEMLRRCNGKVAGKGGAAQLLNIPSTTLHSKIKKLQIAKADYYSR